MTSPFFDSRWGYCADCERWRYSSDWFRSGEPACPVCSAVPWVVEQMDGDRLTTRMDLEVAVGPVGKRRFLSD